MRLRQCCTELHYGTFLKLNFDAVSPATSKSPIKMRQCPQKSTMVQFDRVHPVSRETNVWDSLPYPTEFFLHPYPQRVYGRAYADLITKFSGIDRFPFFLRYENPLRIRTLR